MALNVDPPKTPDVKPAHPGGADDLKSMSMAQLQAQLASSPDGLSEAEAKKRLTQYGP